MAGNEVRRRLAAAFPSDPIQSSRPRRSSAPLAPSCPVFRVWTDTCLLSGGADLQQWPGEVPDIWGPLVSAAVTVGMGKGFWRSLGPAAAAVGLGKGCLHSD